MTTRVVCHNVWGPLRLGWQSWWIIPRTDDRKVHLSIDPTTPPELVSPVFLKVGRGRPIALTESESSALIVALHAAKRAAAAQQ